MVLLFDWVWLCLSEKGPHYADQAGLKGSLKGYSDDSLPSSESLHSATNGHHFTAVCISTLFSLDLRLKVTS